MTLQSYLRSISPLDHEAMQAAQTRWDSIAKPLHSLGLLEENIIKIAGILGTPNVSLTKRKVVVLCADNGVVEEGVTQTGSEITALVAHQLAIGRSSVSLMAQSVNAQVLAVDIGMFGEHTPDGVLPRKVAHGTCNIAKGAAMSRQQAHKALMTGIELVRTLREDGCDIVATGEMGIGNTTTSSAMASVFLGVPVQDVTGRGAGLSGEGLRHKMEVIRRAITVNQPNPDDPLDVLSKVGGYDIAGLAGMFLGGAIYRVPVLMDGFISSVAALTAVKLCPQVQDFLLASHVSKEPAGQMLLHALSCHPMLTCDMGLGEGTGAVAALPILDLALTVYHQASTFSQIQMQAYEPLE